MAKGDLLDECNRTACSNKAARWFNHSTEKYYCSKCACMINDVNPESKRIFGHDLCTLTKVSDEDYENALFKD